MKYTGQFSLVSIVFIFSFFQIFYNLTPLPQQFIEGLLLSIIAWIIGRVYDQMRFNANYDNLTQVFNRRYALKIMQKKKVKSVQTNSPFAVVIIDVINFKDLNHRLGHETGDHWLKGLSMLLMDHTSNSDVVARWGSDEFIIIASGFTQKDTEVFIDNLESDILEQINKAKIPLGIGIAIGNAQYPEEGNSLDEILRVAEQRMFDVKIRTKISTARQSSNGM
ncbi:GGDEF domain-containing protein [Peribacillus simplex]|uniref:GGDEF domain-containing protein n=1 Tax=Peribacillus simplex TaxID=1478 RepID=UPI0025A2CE45|nr:GGDEF domain-containing protein [Peribacillus simplex]MDM5292984.1 GGDEF domain-containing protein [Peribacillus simplex]